MIPTLLVVVLAFTSAILLLSAFVLWFAELIHSLTLSLTITGVVMGVAAWATYHISLRPTLHLIREEYENAMALISLIRKGYDCIYLTIKKSLTNLFE
ncbi:MAG: hypothetical protein SNH73_01700 [Rikenellaceae bacterium]